MTNRKEVEDILIDIGLRERKLLTMNFDTQARISRLEKQVQEEAVARRELKIYLSQYIDALGPLWTTQAGHRRPLSMLSTDHLQRLVDGGWLPHHTTKHRDFAEQELWRRTIDVRFRKPSLWRRICNYVRNR